MESVKTVGKQTRFFFLSLNIQDLPLTLILARGTVQYVFTTMPSEWQVTNGGLGEGCPIKGHDILTGNPNQRNGRT